MPHWERPFYFEVSRVNHIHFQEFNGLRIDDTGIRTPCSPLLDPYLSLPVSPENYTASIPESRSKSLQVKGALLPKQREPENRGLNLDSHVP